MNAKAYEILTVASADDPGDLAPAMPPDHGHLEAEGPGRSAGGGSPESGGPMSPDDRDVLADKDREIDALRDLVREFESALSDARRSSNGHGSGNGESHRMLNDQVRSLRQEVADRTRTIASLKVQLDACHNAMSRHEQTVRLVRQELQDAREKSQALAIQVKNLHGTIDFLNHRKDVDRYGGLTPEEVEQDREEAKAQIRELGQERVALTERVRAQEARITELEQAARAAADLAASLADARKVNSSSRHPWRKVFRGAAASGR